MRFGKLTARKETGENKEAIRVGFTDQARGLKKGVPFGNPVLNFSSYLDGAMMRVTLVLSGFLGLSSAAGASPQHVTPITVGSGFLRDCGPQVPSSDPGMQLLEQGGAQVRNTACNMYILGILDGIDSDADLLERADGKNHRFICAPQNATAGVVREIVVRFIQEAPSFYADFKTNRIASLALAAAYPCPTATPSGAAPPPPHPTRSDR